MKLSRPRLAASMIAALAAATALTVGPLAGGPLAGSTARAATSTRPAAMAQAVGTLPVMVNCLNQQQVRPHSFVLTCADANSGFEHMHWQVWGSTAYAAATRYMNDCVPNCAEGKLYYFPSLVVAWRPEPLPGHPGVRYFSRASWVYTGRHCLPYPGGTHKCLARTGTLDLWSHT